MNVVGWTLNRIRIRLGDQNVYDILLTAILIVSALTILVITLQPAKTMNASDAFIGGGAQLFGKQKVRGFEAFLRKMTMYLGTIFFVLAIILSFVK